MATRTDSTYQFDYSDLAIRRDQTVTLTAWDRLLSNQDLMLRADRLIVSTVEPTNVGKGAIGHELWRATIPGKPRMGTTIGDTLAGTCYIKTWSQVATNYTLRLSDGTNTDDLVVSATHTTPSWRQLTIANVTMPRDGTSGDLSLTLQTTYTPDSVFVGGVLIVKSN